MASRRSAILMALFQADHPIPREELASRVGIKVRALSDDLRALRAAGASIITTTARTAGIGLEADFRAALAKIPAPQRRGRLDQALESGLGRNAFLDIGGATGSPGLQRPHSLAPVVDFGLAPRDAEYD